MTIEQQWQELRETIRAHIAKHGRCIQAVGVTESDAPGTQPFMYTIGNYALGLPELLIVGTDKAPFGGVLNQLSQMQVDRGRAFEHEELVSVGGKFPLRIIDTGDIGHRKYAYFARIYYDSETVEVRQVLLPDEQGRWPDTPGCEAPVSRATDSVCDEGHGELAAECPEDRPGYFGTKIPRSRFTRHMPASPAYGCRPQLSPEAFVERLLAQQRVSPWPPSNVPRCSDDRKGAAALAVDHRVVASILP